MTHDTVAPTPELSTRVGLARRLVDVAVALALMVVALPVIAVAATLVLLLDGRPVFFAQQRVGQDGRPFRLYKLRSMSTSRSGPDVTAAEDPRVTRIGALLRRTSVDELPQLWHVLRGEMTLVGPRPETVALAARYPADCRFVLQVRPGLTGPAQLAYRERAAVPPPGWPDAESWYLSVLVPLRAAADLEFLRRPTVWRVGVYLVRTAAFVAGVLHTERPVAPAPGRR
jgi:lipopolysaccharide/colanic/teichoic acid biosynthesis glycosyltransferase